MRIRRELRVSRGPADRDPMFAAVWYNANEPMVVSGTKHVSPPTTTINLPPLAPPDEASLKWLAVIGHANEVTAKLRDEPDFNSNALVAVVKELVDRDPTAADIIAAYRRRVEGIKHD